jgi:formylmethanofuran dehydrogenase subunit C
MRIEKIVLEKSANTLLERAEDCFSLAASQQGLADKQHEIAAAQHENADQQHENAVRQHSDADKLDDNADKLDTNAIKLGAIVDRLNTMGRALMAGAVEIKGDTLIVQRGRK